MKWWPVIILVLGLLAWYFWDELPDMDPVDRNKTDQLQQMEQKPKPEE